ncbi:ribonuclease H-like domain-containing protein [Tanacetum coccineum]
MPVHGYTNDEFDAGEDNNITLISKLDVSNPLHLHPNDSVALTVVSVKLKGTKNYQVWSCAMLLALKGKNRTGFIDGSCRRSSILSRETLPDVRSAYDIISSEESHKVASDYYSEDQYAVSVKEDTAYPCLHSPKTTEDEAQYAVSRDTQYAVFNIWNEYNILEDIKRGPYSKKSLIRRIQLLGYVVLNRLLDLINRRLKNKF